MPVDIRHTRTTVGIAFTANPGDASPLYTDITSYVRSIDIRVGRSDELDQFVGGTATIVLDNRDGRFTPGNTSSPYSPNVKPQRLVGIYMQETSFGLGTGIFAGTVDDWLVTDYDRRNSTVTVLASDGWQLLAQSRVDSWWRAYVGTLTPWGWWELGANGGADSSGNSRPLTVIAGGDSGTALVADSRYGSAAGSWTMSRSAAVSSSAMTVSFMASAVDGQPVGTVVAMVGSAGADRLELTAAFGYRYDAGLVAMPGHVTVLAQLIDQGVGTTTAVWSEPWSGQPLHVATTRNGSTLALYVNGWVAATGSGSGGSSAPSGNTSIATTTAVVDEVVAWASALTAAQVARLASMAHGTTVMRTDEWLSLALDHVGWGTGITRRSISTNGTLATAPPTGPASDILRILGDTEQGYAYVATGSDSFTVAVQFVSRSDRLTDSIYATASSLVFGDQAGETGYTGLDMDAGGSRVRNQWTVGGVTVADTTSIVSYFERPATVDGVWAIQCERGVLASWLLSRFKNPTRRVRSLTVDPLGSTAAHFTAMESTRFGALTTVTRRPPSGGTITLSGSLESYEWSMTYDRDWTWRATYGLRSAPDGTTYAKVGTATVGGTAVIAP